MDDQHGTVEVPSQIVINGEQYDPTEAQELIGKGKLTREYEQKWNTSLDRVWPEYGQLSQERKQWMTEKETLQRQIQEFQTKQQQGTDTGVDEAKAKEAARKLGIILNEDLEKSGYIKKDELPKYFQQFQSEQEAVQSVIKEADRLASEIDGTDGRPRFNKKAVLAYAKSYGFDDLNKAYEDMHEDQIKAWKKEQIEAKKNPGLKTLRVQGGKKEPDKVSVNDDNINDLLKERLWGPKE